MYKVATLYSMMPDDFKQLGNIKDHLAYSLAAPVLGVKAQWNYDLFPKNKT